MARASGGQNAKARGSAASGNDGAMSVREAGRRGGETVKRAHGSEFYSDIGRKGGEAVRSKHGPEYYSRIGKKGGASNTRTRASGASTGGASRTPRTGT